MLYVAVTNLGNYRPATVGRKRSGWQQPLQAFMIYFEGRIPTFDQLSPARVLPLGPLGGAVASGNRRKGPRK